MMAIPFHVILRLVLKWLLQNVFPQPSMSMLSAPHPHQSLKLIFLKLWNFHICPFVACEMASHGSFSCIYLFTNKLNIFSCFWPFLFPLLWNRCSCISLTFLLNCLFFLLTCRSSSCSEDIHPSVLCQIWLFSLSTDLLKLRDKMHMS